MGSNWGIRISDLSHHSNDWRPWFAWYPVKLNGQGPVVWLEKIYRARSIGWHGIKVDGYEYTDLFGVLKG